MRFHIITAIYICLTGLFAGGEISGDRGGESQSDGMLAALGLRAKCSGMMQIRYNHAVGLIRSRPFLTFTFIHSADGFIQSDLEAGQNPIQL